MSIYDSCMSSVFSVFCFPNWECTGHVSTRYTVGIPGLQWTLLLHNPLARIVTDSVNQGMVTHEDVGQPVQLVTLNTRI